MSIFSELTKFIQKRKCEHLVNDSISMDQAMQGLPDEALISLIQGSLISANKMAALRELCSRVLDLKPYPVQMQAVALSYYGFALDMKTGEGKTLVAALAAVLLSGKLDIVRVATSNEYLAKRDFSQMSPLFHKLGIPIYINEVKGRRGVVYSTLNKFCLNWLSDHISTTSAGKTHFFDETEVSEGIIIDEIDNTLIESSTTPYTMTNTHKTDETSMLRAVSVVGKLSDAPDASENIFDDDFYEQVQSVYSDDFNMTSEDLYSSATSELFLVRSAYTALRELKEGSDYIVKDGFIYRIDSASGRAIRDGFPANILLALQLSKGLQVSDQNRPIITSTLPNYVKRFDFMMGMSGSAFANENELEHIYSLSVASIPENKPSRLKNNGYKLFKTMSGKVEYAVGLVLEGEKRGTPTLVICEDDKQTHVIYETLKIAAPNSDVRLFNSFNIESEDFIIGTAGLPGKITVTTRLCGRGTDIQLGGNIMERQELSQKGGLHVISLGAGRTPIDDIQLQGRTARQGDGGESSILISIEDDVFARNKIAKMVLPACIYSENDTSKLARDKLKTLSKAVLQIQASRQNSYRNHRNQIRLFDKPVAEQLDILMKKRMRYASANSPVETFIAELNKLDLAPLQIERVLNDFKLYEIEFGLDKFNDLVKSSMLRGLVVAWEHHNSRLYALKEESFSQQQGGYYRYKDLCQEAFGEFAVTLGGIVAGEVVTDLAGEYQMNQAKELLLSREEIEQIKDW